MSHSRADCREWRKCAPRLKPLDAELEQRKRERAEGGASLKLFKRPDRSKSDHRLSGECSHSIPYQKGARRRAATCAKCVRQANALGAIQANHRAVSERTKRMINYRHFKRKPLPPTLPLPRSRPTTRRTPTSISSRGILLSIFVIFSCWLASGSAHVDAAATASAASASDQLGRLAVDTNTSNQTSISDKLFPAPSSSSPLPASPLESPQRLAKVFNEPAKRNALHHENKHIDATVFTATNTAPDRAPATATDAFHEQSNDALTATPSPLSDFERVDDDANDDGDEQDDADDSTFHRQAPSAFAANDAYRLAISNENLDDDYNDYGTYIIYNGPYEEGNIDQEGVPETSSSSASKVQGAALQRVFFAARPARQAQKVTLHQLQAPPAPEISAARASDVSTGLGGLETTSAQSSKMSPPRLTFSNSRSNNQVAARPYNIAMRESKLASNNSIKGANQISAKNGTIANAELKFERATVIDGSLTIAKPVGSREHFPRNAHDCGAARDNNEPFERAAGSHHHQLLRQADHLSESADSAVALSRAETRELATARANHSEARNNATLTHDKHAQPTSPSDTLDELRANNDSKTFSRPASDYSNDANDSGHTERRRERRERQHDWLAHHQHHNSQALVSAQANRSASMTANSKAVLAEGVGELVEEDVKWLSKMNANSVGPTGSQRAPSLSSSLLLPSWSSDDMSHEQNSVARDNEPTGARSEGVIVDLWQDKLANNAAPTADHQRGADNYGSDGHGAETAHKPIAPTREEAKPALFRFLDKLSAILGSGHNYSSIDGSDADEVAGVNDSRKASEEEEVDDFRGLGGVNVRATRLEHSLAPSQLELGHPDSNATGNELDEHVDHNVYYWRLVWFILPLGATFGNLLVILAVYRERSLQSVTNYFIVSLAFADLFVGLVVMPFAVYVLVNEVWELSDVLCDIFVAVDVTSSTASILNLVAISIDRYLAIAHPIAYSAGTSSTRASLTIFLVWLISCCVGAPIILGLNTTSERKSTLCILYNSTFIFWSSLTSFYVPCFIMIGLYWRIFVAIKSRTKKAMTHHGHQNHQNAAAKIAPAQTGGAGSGGAPLALPAPNAGGASAAAHASGSVISRQQHLSNQATSQLAGLSSVSKMTLQTGANKSATAVLNAAGPANEISGADRNGQLDKQPAMGVRFHSIEPADVGQCRRTSSCKRRMQSLGAKPDPVSGTSDEPNAAAAAATCDSSGAQPVASASQKLDTLTNDNPIIAPTKLNGRPGEEPGALARHPEACTRLTVADEPSKMLEDSALGTCTTTNGLSQSALASKPEDEPLGAQINEPSEECALNVTNAVIAKRADCLNLSRLAEEEKQMVSKRGQRQTRASEHNVSPARRKYPDADLENANIGDDDEEASDEEEDDDEEEEDDDEEDEQVCDVSGCVHHRAHDSLCNSADLIHGHHRDSATSSTRSSMSYDCSLMNHDHNCKQAPNQPSTPSRTGQQHRCCRQSLANCFVCDHRQPSDAEHQCQLTAPSKNSARQRKRSSVMSSNFCCDSYATSTRCAGHSLATSVSFECTSSANNGRCTQPYCACYDQLQHAAGKPKNDKRLQPRDESLAYSQEKGRMPNGSPKRQDNSVQNRPISMLESARQKIKRRSIRLTNILRGRLPSQDVQLDGTKRKISLDSKAQYLQPAHPNSDSTNRLSQNENVFRISGSKIPISNDEATISSDALNAKRTSSSQNDEIFTGLDRHKLDCLQEIDASSQLGSITTSNVHIEKKFIQVDIEGASAYEPSVCNAEEVVQSEYNEDLESKLKPTTNATEMSTTTGDRLTTLTSSTGRSTTMTDKSSGSSESNTNNSACVPDTNKSTSSKRPETSVLSRKNHSTHLVSSVFELIHRKNRSEHANTESKHSSHVSLDQSMKAPSTNKLQLKSQLKKGGAVEAARNQLQAQRHRAGGGSRRRREKNAARRERKATKTLAIVLGIFLICWTPFFTCNIIDGICIRLGLPESRPGMTAYLITSWLGYMNSCVNPIIYTIFNMEFRRAFKRILTTRPDCSGCTSCIG